MGIQSVIISDQEASGSYPASPLTAAEAAVLRRTDLLSWTDAKGYSREISGSDHLSQWRSRKLIGANQPQFNSSTTNDYPYGGYDPADLTQFEFRIGMNASGTNVSGFNNRTMLGNQFMTIPQGDFTIALYARVLTPANQTVFLGGNSTSQSLCLTATSSGVIRFYSDWQAGTFISTAAAVLDTSYHLIIFKYNQASNLGSIELDNSVVKVPTALTIPQPYADVKFNIGSVLNGATRTAGIGWAVMGILMINSIDDVTLNLYRAVLTERGL